MAKDFKASQIRTAQIIASGSTANKPSLLIVSASSPGVDFDGAGIGNSTLLNGVGRDVFIFISGTKSSKGTNTPGLTLFGGDVQISGTLYGGVAGSNTQVQFNDAGTFGASAGLTYNKTTNTLVNGNASSATGNYSHAEGLASSATGDYSHAEGVATNATNYGAHSEGYNTFATGQYSHAEGDSTIASADGAHAEGYNTIAAKAYSHAQGNSSIASGTYSFAGGNNTIASGSAQTVIGKYNRRNNATSLFVVGNGTNDTSRSDIFLVDSDTVRIGSGSSLGTDVFLFTSGTVGSKGTSTKGTAVFGGDVVISGTAYNAAGNAYGNVAGSDKQVQFNDAGAFGASAGLTYDKNTQTLSVGNLIVTGTTTTVSSTNIVIKDPIIYFGSSSAAGTTQGGIALASGSSVTDQAMVFGKIATNTWGAGRLDVQAGQAMSMTTMEPIALRVAKLELGNTNSFLTASSNTLIMDANGGTYISSSAEFERDRSLSFREGATIQFTSESAGLASISFGSATKNALDIANASYPGQTSVTLGVVHTDGVDLGISFFKISGSSESFDSTTFDFDVRKDNGILRSLQTSDVNFFVTGSMSSKGTATRGTALFGGDVVISGTLHGGSPLKVSGSMALSGSLRLQTQDSAPTVGSNESVLYVLNDGGTKKLYWKNSDNTQQQIGTGGGSGATSGTFNEVTVAGAPNSFVTTASVSFAGQKGFNWAVDDVGADVFFFASGSKSSKGTATRGTSVFGGDTVISGTLVALSNQQLTGSLSIVKGNSQFTLDDSFSAGFTNTTSNTYGVAIGTYNNVKANAAGALGNLNTVSLGADYSFGIGTGLMLSGAVVPPGLGLGGSVTTQVAVGNWNTLKNDSSILVVGNGYYDDEITFDYIRRDILSVDYDMIRLGSGSRAATDVFLNISGAKGSRGTSTRGTTVIGGDLFSSGTAYFEQGLSGSLTKLTDGSSYLIAGSNVTITTGSNGAVTIASTGGGGGGSGDANATYLVLSATGSLNNERVITAGTGISTTDAGAGGNYTIAINDSVVATVSGTTFTGVVKANAGLSGSLTKLTDGTSYLIAGSNVTITTGSNGAVTIAGTPGGSDTQVQFNDGGSFGGNSGLTYNKTTNTLSVGNLVVTGSTTTVTSSNLVISDQVIYFGSGSTSSNTNGGIALASGSVIAGQALVWGRVANNTWGAGRLDVVGGTSTDLTSMALVPIRSSKMELGASTAYISSSDGVGLILSGSTVLTGTLATSGTITIEKGGSLVLKGGTTSGAGNIQLGAAANGSYDTNLVYLDTDAKTGGFVFGSTPALGAANGPFFGGRGNTYSAIAGQRGNLYLGAGGPSTPGSGEGQVVILDGGAAVRMRILYGGAIEMSGTARFSSGLSGSLTKLQDGTSYLIAGTNVTITTGSNGAVTIASTATGGGDSFFSSTTAGSIFTTGSVAIRGDESSVDAPSDKGSDVFFYVSGSKSSKDGATPGVSMFGGDLMLSGSTYVASGSSILPVVDRGSDLGSSSKRWGNVYTGDLHLRNDRGDWTIVEEEDYLCVVNNKTGKKFKMALIPLEE